MAAGTNTLDVLIGLNIAAVACLAGVGVTVPQDLNYALLALIAGRLGTTVPKPPPV